MKTAFIFHGTAGHPKENWFQWLKEKLEERGYKVIIPQFPTPEGQSFDSWMKILNNYKKDINEETIMIGHSLGGLFLLMLLEKLKSPIKTVAFIATSIGIKPILYYLGDLDFAGDFDFNYEKVKQNAKNFIVFHSDNDPYIDLKNGQVLAKNLGVKLNFIPNAGHFNTKSGYTTFVELYNSLEKFF